MSFKNPDFKILSQATGKPTNGFVGRPVDTFEARAWFLADAPDGDVQYEWQASPPDCVTWLDETFDWKRKFCINGEGTITVQAKDQNGFYLSTPSCFVKLSG